MSGELTDVTPTHESNQSIISSISQMIVPLTSSISSAITSTLSDISHVVPSALESPNHDIDLFPEVSCEHSRTLDHIINTDSVLVENDQSKLVSSSSIENECVSIKNNNCAVSNPEIKTFNSDVVKVSNVNDNNNSTNNEVHINTVYTPVSQPWSVASYAASTITYDLPLIANTPISPHVCNNNNIMSNKVVIEPCLPAVGSLWPAEFTSDYFCFCVVGSSKQHICPY